MIPAPSKTIALSFWSYKMQVVKTSEENGSNISPIVVKQQTRLFVSRPNLFNHLSHQIPKMRNSQ